MQSFTTMCLRLKNVKGMRIALSALFSISLVTAIAGHEILSEYVEVTTRKHVDNVLGFAIEYPYEWEPSRNPLTDSDFYVGAPYAMPSFWLNVEPKPDDLKLADSLNGIDEQEFPNHKGIEPYALSFNGHEAMSVDIYWETQDAGRHFVETKLITFFAGDLWFTLRVVQSYRETRWRPRLQALLDSFMVLSPGT